MEIRIYKFPLPAKSLYNMSSSAVQTPESTIVEIIDNKGTIGYGEACMATSEAQRSTNESIRVSLSILGPSLIGVNPTDLSLINETMGNALVGEQEAKAAIDIACWDLIGKKLNVSVAELLGGNINREVLTYHVVGIASPEEASAEARRLQKMGITRLQLKAGGRRIEADISSIKAVSEATDEETVLDVDTNCGWTQTEATEVSKLTSRIDFSLEQPCRTNEELIAIKSKIFHPLIIVLFKKGKNGPDGLTRAWKKTGTVWYISQDLVERDMYYPYETTLHTGRELIMTTIKLSPQIRKKFIQIK